jgi:hypothetical protein
MTVKEIDSRATKGVVLIDYHAHALALDEAQKSLAAAAFTEPVLVAARSQAQSDLAAAGGYALLGALVDHLFAHAESDGSELALLARASDLFDRGVGLYNDLGSVRNRFETALANPSDPAALSAFNTASMDVQLFAQKAYAMQGEVSLLRSDVSSLTYLSAHPRQLDDPSSSWDWGNLLLGRRTDAFVRNLSRLAQNTATRAFAFGALSGYGANAAGSSYLGHVVGGPRRSHRFRDRVARNAIGSWLARKFPATQGPGEIANRIRFGGRRRPVLPHAVEQLLKEALKTTFDLSKTPPPPDLQLGYRRMLQHLHLLDGFVRPPIPAAPQPVWLQKIYGDPSNPPPSLRPQDLQPSGDPGGGISLGNNSPGDPSPGQSDNSSSGSICGIIVAILIIIDLIQAFVQCIGQWANKHKCTFWDNMLLKKAWEKDPPDPRDPPTTSNVSSTSSELTAIASSDEITQLIACLFDIHTQIWEALDRAYHFLAFHGLIYPGSLIDVPAYSQFTTTPATTPWPRRPVNDPMNSYHLYPGSPLEHPTTTPSGLPVGAKPDAFLTLAAARFTLPVWEQIAFRVTDTVNYDLDADRGFLHACWAIKGSINDDPVDVNILAYTDQ